MNDRRSIFPLSLLIGAVLSIVFLVGFGAGVVFQGQHAAASADSNDANLKDFLTAYHLVTQRSYYRPFDKRHLIYAAIDGMLAATGDPHTLFLSPPQNRVADQELNGSQFSGIGAMVAPDNGYLQIVTPLPRTPAADAGLQPGDLVTKIDGQSVSRMSGDGAIARIHGRAGTTVRLTIMRGNHRPFTVNVRRAEIPPITAYGKLLGHGLGYIQIFSFGDNTSQEVADALTLLKQHHVRAIVLDLRDNPGGYVDAAQHVVSQFLARGVVAYEEGTNKQLVPLSVVPGTAVSRLPLAVLVNSGTASAAEITAGALHDNARAEIIGTRTYGKGSMQSVYTLADGSTIRITDRLWLTPRKRSIQKVGIQPDVVVNLSVADASSGADSQLAAAERYLNSHRSP